jgi:hypothetical protein
MRRVDQPRPLLYLRIFDEQIMRLMMTTDYSRGEIPAGVGVVTGAELLRKMLRRLKPYLRA